MDAEYRVYVWVCWGFAAAFLVFLVGIAVVPGLLVDFLNWQGELFGFSGEIRLGAADLDHVLSVSLMACVFALAVFSAQNPASDELFMALMAAKVVSTLGFTYLLVLQGGVWLVPALADGTVAAGLFVARRIEVEGGAASGGASGPR